MQQNNYIRGVFQSMGYRKRFVAHDEVTLHGLHVLDDLTGQLYEKYKSHIQHDKRCNAMIIDTYAKKSRNAQQRSGNIPHQGDFFQFVRIEPESKRKQNMKYQYFERNEEAQENTCKVETEIAIQSKRLADDLVKQCHIRFVDQIFL